MIEVARLSPHMIYRLVPAVGPEELRDRIEGEVRRRYPKARTIRTWLDSQTGDLAVEVDDATGGALGSPALLLTGAAG